MYNFYGFTASSTLGIWFPFFILASSQEIPFVRKYVEGMLETAIPMHYQRTFNP